MLHLGELMYREAMILNQNRATLNGNGETLNRGYSRGLKLTDQIMKIIQNDPESHIFKKVNSAKM